MKINLGKFSSRKFQLGMGGLLSGIGMYLSGDKAHGTDLMIKSVLAYIGAEGLVDALNVLTNIKVNKSGGK